MTENIIKSLISFDADLTELIKQFLSSYDPYKNPPLWAAYLDDFIKVIIYSLFAIAPLLFLKVFFPYKRIFNWIIYLILIIAGLALFGILLGFLQLLYS